MNCWRCGGTMVDYKNGLGVHCMMCCRTPDRTYHEQVEKAQAKQRGNPKTYGSYNYKRNPDLEGFALSLLAKMCRE